MKRLCLIFSYGLVFFSTDLIDGNRFRNFSMMSLVKKKPDLFKILKDFRSNSDFSKEFLYKQYYGYIMGVIVRYTSNIPDSEELVNDSFIKIFNHVQHFKCPADPLVLEKAFKGWIATIASRTAIDFIKKPRLFVCDDEITEMDHPLTFPEEMMRLDLQDLLNLLNKLPEIQRLIFNLYEIEGFSHLEISTMLNIKENISRVYLTRAKQRLKFLYQINMESNGTY